MAPWPPPPSPVPLHVLLCTLPTPNAPLVPPHLSPPHVPPPTSFQAPPFPLTSAPSSWAACTTPLGGAAVGGSGPTSVPRSSGSPTRSPSSRARSRRSSGATTPSCTSTTQPPHGNCGHSKVGGSGSPLGCSQTPPGAPRTLWDPPTPPQAPPAHQGWGGPNAPHDGSSRAVQVGRVEDDDDDAAPPGPPQVVVPGTGSPRPCPAPPPTGGGTQGDVGNPHPRPNFPYGDTRDAGIPL